MCPTLTNVQPVVRVMRPVSGTIYWAGKDAMYRLVASEKAENDRRKLAPDMYVSVSRGEFDAKFFAREISRDVGYGMALTNPSLKIEKGWNKQRSSVTSFGMTLRGDLDSVRRQLSLRSPDNEHRKWASEDVESAPMNQGGYQRPSGSLDGQKCLTCDKCEHIKRRCDLGREECVIIPVIDGAKADKDRFPEMKRRFGKGRSKDWDGTRKTRFIMSCQERIHNHPTSHSAVTATEEKKLQALKDQYTRKWHVSIVVF